MNREYCKIHARGRLIPEKPAHISYNAAKSRNQILTLDSRLRGNDRLITLHPPATFYVAMPAGDIDGV